MFNWVFFIAAHCRAAAATCHFDALNPAAVAMATSDEVSQRFAFNEFDDDVRLPSVDTDANHIRQRPMTHLTAVEHVTVIIVREFVTFGFKIRYNSRILYIC